MAIRPDPMAKLGTRTADDAPRSRRDASSLRGLQLLKGDIFPSAFIRATANKTAGNGATVQVDFDTTDWDTTADDAGGHADFSQADLANNQLVCRVTGVYDIQAGLKFVAATDGTVDDDVFLILRRNGTNIKVVSTYWIDDATFATALGIGTKARLDKGDTVTLHVIQRTGFGQSISNGDSEPFLCMTWEAMFSGAAP